MQPMLCTADVPCACSFKCGIDYHAPTDCDTIKKWLTKCADDSETANYISAHTKDVRNTATMFSFTENIMFIMQHFMH